jgi:xanthine dehydrogenase YagS FAD-binding subunit
MQAFEYASPKTLKEALSLLGAGWNDAAVLAGGTDLLSLMKDYIATPKRVVNVKGIPELKGVSKTPQGLRIGALATFDELMSNPLVRGEYNAIFQAVQGVTSPQIRNMGTAAGDLCQRPRCWYFRNGFGLLAMQNGQSLVTSGENRYHAIFPQGPAMFVSASSLGPALIALGAKVKVAGSAASRDLEVEKFFVAPREESAREIALAPNEIVTEILIPSVPGLRSATYEVRQKDALDWPLATASVAVTLQGMSVKSARIVLGHVGPTPVVAEGAAKAIIGKTITPETAEAAGAAAVQDAKPLSDNAYKVQLAKVAVKRALLAVGRARG